MTSDVAAVSAHVRRTLREVAQLDGLSIGIGGLVSPGGGALVLSELHNLQSGLLRGALIRPGTGLGGAALMRRRPVAVEDYVESTEITHHFDKAVLVDRIRGAVAVPVVVNSDIRAVIYGATRGEAGFGERTVATLVVMARRLAHDISVEEEVQRRLRAIREELAEQSRYSLSPVELSELNAELAAIAAAVEDPGLRERVLCLRRRLSGNGIAPAAPPTRTMVHLSQRETDVLGQLAAGCTNAEIAERLCILPTTVKTHLRNTMRKLGARNRVETISAARSAGLLP